MNSVALLVLEDMEEHMTGTQAIKRLQAQGSTARMVSCSGNCLAEDRIRYLAAGASDVWPKPYPDTSTIRQHLQSWFTVSSDSDAR